MTRGNRKENIREEMQRASQAMQAATLLFSRRRGMRRRAPCPRQLTAPAPRERHGNLSLPAREPLGTIGGEYCLDPILVLGSQVRGKVYPADRALAKGFAPSCVYVGEVRLRNAGMG